MRENTGNQEELAREFPVVQLLFRGIVVSLEKMNKILEVDKIILLATVEPGVTYCPSLRSEIDKYNFYFLYILVNLMHIVVMWPPMPVG